MLALLFLTTLPIIEDDYPRAAAQAAREGKPIVIDFWAPWCHACLSMQQYVFTDPLMEPLVKDAVFVAIDTDKDKNAAITQRFQPRAWPTFVIVDAQDKHVIGRLLGGATAKEFAAFIKTATVTPPALREADELATLGKVTEAKASYQRAVTGASGAVLGRAAVGLASMQESDGDFAGCEKTAVAYVPKLQGSYYGLSLLLAQAGCAMEQKKATDALVKPIRDAIDSAALALSADDKSDLYATLAEMAEARGDQAEVRRLREARLQLLEAAAKQAPTSEAARVFDAHRTDVYLSLGRPDDAIAMLGRSEKTAPNDYNPPARLARAYLAKNDLSNAKAAIVRAKARVYGPRAAVVALLEGDILSKANDKAGARSAYSAAKATLEKQPQTASVKMRMKDIDGKLNAL